MSCQYTPPTRVEFNTKAYRYYVYIYCGRLQLTVETMTTRRCKNKTNAKWKSLYLYFIYYTSYYNINILQYYYYLLPMGVFGGYARVKKTKHYNIRCNNMCTTTIAGWRSRILSRSLRNQTQTCRRLRTYIMCTHRNNAPPTWSGPRTAVVTDLLRHDSNSRRFENN